MYQQTGQTPLPARRPMNCKTRSSATRRRSRAEMLEPLEARTLYAIQLPITLSPAEPVNVTQLRENQHTSVIAVNRADPGNVYVATVTDNRFTGPLDDVDLNGDELPDQLNFFEDQDGNDDNNVNNGLLSAISTNGGRDFTLSGLAPSAISPSVAYDRFGNLFITYFTKTQVPDIINGGFDEVTGVIVEGSSDSGQTFTPLAAFEVTGFDLGFSTNFTIDPITGIITFTTDQAVVSVESPQPTIVTGADSVWISYESDGAIFAAGARVRGLGAIDPFIDPQAIPRSEGGRFSDIAIGPAGEVMVTYEILRNDPNTPSDPESDLGDAFFVDNQFVFNDPTGPGDIYVNVDPDGLGAGGFGQRFKVSDTRVGLFDPIPAQNERKIDAAPGLVWDRSGGPFNGRAWLVYTDETRDESNSDTEIFLRFSDDNGRTWSSRRQVNDEDVTEGSQFFPNIALDQTTGNVAITWYDTRFQNGISVGENDEVQFYGTVGVPTVAEAGIAFADNLQLSRGFSDAPRSRNIFEYGEYSDLDFDNNVFYAVWSDNSNSTGNNPSGGVNAGTNLATFDAYTTRVTVLPNSPRPPELAPVGPGSPLTPEFVGRDTLTKGKNFKFQVRYTSANGVDQSTLGDDDLLITGPNGYNLFADFTKSKQAKRGTIVTATYLAPAPGGLFDVGDNGLYSILVQGGSVAELGGAVVTVDGLLNQFLVSSNVRAQSPALHAAPAVSASLKSSDASEADDDSLLKAVGL